MAAKTTYTAKDPNGVEHTRTTARVYSHAVFSRLDLAAKRKEATSAVVAENERRNHSYYVDSVKNNSNREHKNDEFDRLYLRFASMTPEEFVAERVAERICLINACGEGEFSDAWYEVGFCGRIDLAQKMAAKYRSAVIVAL